MAYPTTSTDQNQITSEGMKDHDTLQLDMSPMNNGDGATSFMPLVVAAIAVSTIGFGYVASTSSQPVLFTLIAVLAMLGLFFIFGVFFGHIRIGAPARSGEIVRSALDDFRSPVLVTDAQVQPVYWNRAFDHVFGRAGEGPLEALGAASSLDPDSSQAIYRLMRAAEHGEFMDEEIKVRGRRVEDDLRTFRIRLEPFTARQESGGLLSQGFVHWHVSDVSAEAHRRAQACAELEKTLALFDHMPAGFFAVDAGGVIRYVNKAFEEWLGFEDGTLRSQYKTISDLAGDEGARLLAELATAEQAEQRVVELDLTGRDGRIVPLTLFVETSGDGFSLTAINRNTVDRRVLDHAGMMHFFQSAPFGVAILDKDGRIASNNSALTRMTADAGPLNNTSVVDVLCRHAEDDERAKLVGAMMNVLAGRGDFGPVDLTSGKKKQSAYRVYLSPLAPVSGQGVAALYVVDTTEQRALEARVAQAEKMEAVGTLAGGVAHDFNNVLSVIMGYCGDLLQTHRTTDPAYRDIKSIESAAQRAAGLVANLLGFSRKQTQQFSVLNLSEISADMANIVRTMMGEKVQVKVRSERDLWFVRADNSQIFNIILNLSRNARDAMPDGGTLTIRTRNVTEGECHKLIDSVPGFAMGEYVAIEIGDTGTGMSSEVMSKVFEPFFTTKGVGKGTGLGLASVYGIVKQSGGYIIPESEVGVGTTFTILLPRYLPAEEEIGQTAATQTGKVVSAKGGVAASTDAKDLTGTGRVLLVEDEVQLRQISARVLKRQGYEVLEASEGAEALDIMQDAGDIDLVVSDVVMPEMDGPTMFKELRKRNPSLKVIFVSGYPNEAFRETLGTDDFAFLPKPYSNRQLAEKVKEELSR